MGKIAEIFGMESDESQKQEGDDYEARTAGAKVHVAS